MVPNTRTKREIGGWPNTQTSLQQISTVLDGQIKQFFMGAGTAAEILDAVATPTIDASLIETLSVIDCTGGSIAIVLPDISAAMGGSTFTESHRNGDGFLKVFCLLTIPSPGGNTATITGPGFSSVVLSASNNTAMFVWQGLQWNLLIGQPPLPPTGLAPWYGLADPAGDNAFTIQQNVYDPYPGVVHGANRMVFGADSAEQPPVPAVQSKLIFSNMDLSSDNGSFSAGIIDSTGPNPTAWDLANRGLASTRLGDSNQASGITSSALAGSLNVITSLARASSILAGNALTCDQPNTAVTQNFDSRGQFQNGFARITAAGPTILGVNFHYVVADAVANSVDLTLPAITAANDRKVLCITAFGANNSAAHHVTVTATGGNLVQLTASASSTVASFTMFGGTESVILVASQATGIWYNFNIAPFNGTSPFKTDGSGNIVQDITYPADSYESNFLYGSSSLSQNGIAIEQQKLLFYANSASGASGAFRAGVVTGTQWDLANVGPGSVAFANNNTASASNSGVFSGNANQANATSSGVFTGDSGVINATCDRSAILAGQLHVISSPALNSSILSGNNLTNSQPNCAMMQALRTTEGFRNAFVRLTPAAGSNTVLASNVNHYVLVDMTNTAGIGATCTVTLPAISAANDGMVLNFAIHCEAPGDPNNTCVVTRSGGDLIASSSTTAASATVTLSASPSVSAFSSFTLISNAATRTWWMDIGGGTGAVSGAQDLAKTLHTSQVSGGSPTTTALFPTVTYIGGQLANLNLDQVSGTFPTNPCTVPGPLGLCGTSTTLTAADINIQGGFSGTSGLTAHPGGAVNITGGRTAGIGANSSPGGSVNIVGGTATAGTNNGGSIAIISGSGTTGSGTINISTGTAATTSGPILMFTGSAGGGSGTGNIGIHTAAGVASGFTGDIDIQTGTLIFPGTTGLGNIGLRCTGSTSAGVQGGSIALNAGGGNVAGATAGTVTIRSGGGANAVTTGAVSIASGSKSSVNNGNTGPVTLQSGDTTERNGGTGTVIVKSGDTILPTASGGFTANASCGTVLLQGGSIGSNSAGVFPSPTVRGGHVNLAPGYTTAPFATQPCGEVVLGLATVPVLPAVQADVLAPHGTHLVIQQPPNPIGGVSTVTASGGTTVNTFSTDSCGTLSNVPTGNVTVTYGTPWNSVGFHVPVVILQAFGVAGMLPAVLTASTPTAFQFNNPLANGGANSFMYHVMGNVPWA